MLSRGEAAPGAVRAGRGAAPLVLAAVALYYGAHLALRSLLPGGAGLDDAEQVIAAQVWAWGYGPQPPLYTWIQKLVFEAFGTSVFSIVLLRNLLLAGTVLAVFAIGRQAGGDRVGLLAAGSMLLVPQFAWESQHSHTHTLLVVLLDALAALAFLRLVERRGAADHLAFGVLTGLAFLAKSNGVILPAALVGAALARRESRAAVLDRRIGLALAAGLAVAAVPSWWMLENRDLVLARLGKFGADEGWSGAGALALAVRTVSFAALLGVAWAALLWPGRRHPALPAPGPEARLLALAVAIALGLILAGVLLTGTTRMKERWLQPVLFLLPVLAAAWGAPRLGGRAARWFWRIVAGLAALVLLMIPVHHFFGAFGKPPREVADFPRLLERLEAEGPVGTLFSDSHSLAGNLRLVDPGLVAVVPEYPLDGMDLPRPWVAVWRDRGGAEPPGDLAALIAEKGAAANGTAGTVQAPWKWPFKGGYPVRSLSLAPATENDNGVREGR